jgi:anti-anti-sigma regulatory factor
MSFEAPSGLFSYMAAPRPSTILCDVGALSPDAAAVEALARLQLAARRIGLEIRLCRASSELCDLLALCGLEDVLRIEAGGESKQREDGLGAEEERKLDDPAV